jgi:hypothetical protein
MKDRKIGRGEATSKASHHSFFLPQNGLGLSAPPSAYSEYVAALLLDFLHALGEDGNWEPLHQATG